AMPGELIRREALERIIQRAAELQAGERDIGEGLTEPEVLALGHDVGIPARYLRQALLEEQTRSVVTGGTGLFAWLTGPSLLTAERVVPGDRGAVERALTVWMEREESLQVKRRYPDRTTWDPRVGAFASIQRGLGAGGRRRRCSSGGAPYWRECGRRSARPRPGRPSPRSWRGPPHSPSPAATAARTNASRWAWSRCSTASSTAKSSPSTRSPARASPRSPASPRNSARPSTPPPRGRGPGASWLTPVRERNDRDTAGRGAGVRPDG